MYSYAKERPTLFTDHGARMLESVKRVVLRKRSGERFSLDEALRYGETGDSWMKIACIDKLVEEGVIVLIARGSMTQYNMYMRL